MLGSCKNVPECGGTGRNWPHLQNRIFRQFIRHELIYQKLVSFWDINLPDGSESLYHNWFFCQECNLQLLFKLISKSMD